VLGRYNDFAQSQQLSEILADSSQLKEFIYGRDVVDLLNQFPVILSSQDFTSILRKLQPRLYSISSSLKTHPQEVHLTIAAIRYNNGRYKEGVCSTFLSDRVENDAQVRVFVEKNPEFKLPANPNAPVIMVGPGTGVAPFRAFLQERLATGAPGKNWLFCGNWNFATDFLYQTEFQTYYKKGLLTNLHVAFSRDTEQKLYVQHKMLQHSRELYDWLENGASFYVCGDMKRMWKDVNLTLLQIIQSEGGLSTEKAEDYLQYLKKTKRYQVDVY
jgi:sulfite reductase (NADPH) flavoprotein alpha-component